MINSDSLGLGLDVSLVVSIRYARVVVEDLGLLDIEDEHSVRSEINRLANATGNIRIRSACYIQSPVSRAPTRREAVELVNIASRLEAKALEQAKRRLLAKN